MTRARSLLGLVAVAVLLLAQLHVGGAKGCSMCGASCRCASHASAASCCARVAGCGGFSGGDATGPDGPIRVVLVAAEVVLPPSSLDRTRPASFALPAQPVRAPLDRPPRASC